MRRLGIVTIGMIIGLFLTNSVYAQKTKFQSIFIYNFSKYIKWPDDFNQGKFVIGVLGDSDLLEDLKAMAAAKKETNGLEIDIISYTSFQGISECNLLFITAKFCKEIGQISSTLSDTPTLIVTDKKGMAQEGAVINFVEEGSKIKFELNKAAANKLGLVISSSLANLAILV
jgi:hypothetical protein